MLDKATPTDIDLHGRTEAEWAYLAGLIDGEGCIGIYKTGRMKIGQMQLCITNTDEQMVAWVRERFGCGISIDNRANVRTKPLYKMRWRIGTSVRILERVAEYLQTVKRARAKIALAFCARQRRGLRIIASEENINERRRLAEAMRGTYEAKTA